MQHELQVKIMKELMSQLDEGRNVDAGVQYKAPTSVYTCKDTAKKEWDSFFQNHPQLIGMSGDLLEPDTFFTIDDFSQFILFLMSYALCKVTKGHTFAYPIRV